MADPRQNRLRKRPVSTSVSTVCPPPWCVIKSRHGEKPNAEINTDLLPPFKYQLLNKKKDWERSRHLSAKNRNDQARRTLLCKFKMSR